MTGLGIQMPTGAVSGPDGVDYTITLTWPRYRQVASTNRYAITCQFNMPSKRRRLRVWRTSPMYGFNLARQLDGTMDRGPRYGSHCLTAARVRAGWGCVAYWRWPYPRRGKGTWPPTEPPGLDALARYNRVFSHFRVRSLYDARACLSRAGVFEFSLPMTRAWRAAPNGLIPMPTNDGEFVEQHAVTAAGYDDRTRLIKFVNNWGIHWGDNGIGYLPYEYFETYLSDAWFSWPMLRGHWLPDPTPKGYCRRLKILINGLGHPCAIIDLWNITEDIRIGWCFMTLRDGYLDIEDYFLRPGASERNHHRYLARSVIDFAADQGLRLRIWVAHADYNSCATNFQNLQDLLRETGINVRRSPVRWSAYVGEQAQA